jgi:hypothetical protein
MNHSTELARAMTLDEYIEIHQRLCDEARELSKAKNHDYAGAGGAFPFANFERCEMLGVTTTTRGFLVRMTDKLSRIIEFARTGTFAVQDEKLEDTIKDLINYACLLYAYEQDRKRRLERVAARE